MKGHNDALNDWKAWMCSRATPHNKPGPTYCYTPGGAFLQGGIDCAGCPYYCHTLKPTGINTPVRM